MCEVQKYESADSNEFNRAVPADGSPTLENLEAVITAAYDREVWLAVKAGLGVVCSLALKGRAQPLSLIYEGPSGAGKSTCINMFEPDRESTRKYLYRLDNFTSKAFVTHAANVSRACFKNGFGLKGKTSRTWAPSSGSPFLQV